MAFQELLTNPMFHLGLGLLSAGQPRVGGPANVGEEIQRALGGLAQQQEAAQLQKMREVQFGQQMAQQQAAQQEAARRQAFMQWLRQNPQAAPGDITRQAIQATGDVSLVKQLHSQQPQLMNIPGNAVVFDPETREVVFQNLTTPQAQQRPMVVTDPGTGLPKVSRDQGRTWETPPGFTPRPPTKAEVEARADPAVIEIEPGVQLQTKPLTTKDRDALVTDVTAYQNTAANLDRLATSAAELMNHPGLVGISGVRGAIPSFPGSAAFDADAKLETLKSQIGFAVLQAMRDASKTGGAVGQVSNYEQQLLQNNMDALKKAQSLEQFQQSLKNIIDQATATKGRLRGAITNRYGAQEQPAQVRPAPEARAAEGKRMTQADVQATARASGRTVQEVIEAARRAGYRID